MIEWPRTKARLVSMASVSPNSRSISSNTGRRSRPSYWPENTCPAPVRRVDIPKPQGGVRTLGSPTLTDRLIQQALHQVLLPIFEVEFFESSYGFRPGRNAHQAVKAAWRFVAEGLRVVVDMDLEKFFDRVNHDLLMQKLSTKIKSG